MTKRASIRQFGVVLRHEYTHLLRSKFFRGLTIVILLAIVLVLTLPNLLSQQSSQNAAGATQKILVSDDTGLFTASDFTSLTNYTVTVEQGTLTAAQLNSVVSKGTYAIAVQTGMAGGQITLNLVTQRLMDTGLPAMLQTVAAAVRIEDVMNQYGVPPDTISQAMTSPTVNVTELSGSFESTFLATYIMIMLLFYTILAYGAMVATGVAQEKSSRAMELLITSARTSNLIYGKILGIGLAGLSQLALWLVAMLVFSRINYSYWQSNSTMSAIFNLSAGEILLMLLFYLLGFFMFAAIWGAIGSLVSRVEDTQMANMPVTLLLMIGLFVGIFGSITPNSLLLKIFSFIPLYTPMCMFARFNDGGLPWWELVIGIVESVAAVGFFAFAAAKIYRVGVLMYGKFPTPRELWKALTAGRRSRARRGESGRAQ